MRLYFTMPSDQEFPQEFWERIGIGDGWDALEVAFSSACAEVSDCEEIIVEFPNKCERQVRAIIEAARSGEYGKDVQRYWKSAKEGKK